ncbi:MAG: SMC-Scp complex subunit ScpB [Gammaproteobacteria bacterium]|nr:SMC-Scp complex subunit ScpB [Gammaproteobacteria bacterium]MBU1776534.1 SMC-Scp complex subunit ScpB [Gammaproteobacteria bacterium]MBU1968790.1 SMC-Scp complex subunit ScpB [Gammaproteobacteria bacterium]
MSEPVEQSLPSEQNTAVHPESPDPVQDTAVEVAASTDVAELEHAVDTEQLLRIFEAALLTTQEPLSSSELKRLSEIPIETRFVEELLQKLADKYADSGIELNRVASGWRFRARPELQPHLDRLDPQKPPRYSRAVLETLAIIAYRQPVTRGDIEDIRGVAVSTQVLKTLEARGWIESIGTRDTPGKPALYATTPQFMDDLNLRSLQELPALEEMGTLLDVGHEEAPLLEAGQEETPAGTDAP